LTISDVISMLGAIALFLFGMTTMTDGLEKLSSGRLERILERLTSNVWKGVLLGALVTGLIQSSAATTVMCVGFVNAGIMKLQQTVGIIMGANIGTTVTAQLLRLGDISSDNLFLSLLKPSILGPLLAIVGIVLYMFVKSGKKGMVGQIILGLGVLFIGMKTMENAVSGLQDMPEFAAIMVTFTNPLLGVLAGAAVTALIQSSSASMGILQAITSTGVVQFNLALPLIFGQNIGTCITAILSSIGASKNAKRTACIHLLFNIIGTVVFLILLYLLNAVFSFSFWTEVMNRGSIANLHLLFNVACTLLLLPFHKQLVRLVEWLIPDHAEEEEMEESILDERFLVSPSLALEKAREAVQQMGILAQKNYDRSIELLNHFDQKQFDRLQEVEKILDKLESSVDNYLIKLANRALTAEESALVSELIHTLSDFERIGDYAVNIAEGAVALHKRDLTFSKEAKGELEQITRAVSEIVNMTANCYVTRNVQTALKVEPLEQVVDLLRERLQDNHVERLKQGGCTMELGTQFLELLINLERISDHCSNIALHVLRGGTPEGAQINFSSHEYLDQLHKRGNKTFDHYYSEYKKQYMVPSLRE